MNHSTSSPELVVFPVDCDPYGVPYQQWTVRWWRWISSIPKNCNPTLDLTGSNVNELQDGKVLFLCQTLESSSVAITRKSYIPKVEAIFLPIINWISIMDVDGTSEEELISVAKRKIDAVQDLRFKIDGVELTDDLLKYRVSSPFFYIELPGENIFGLPAGKRKATSDGYWLFFKSTRKFMKFSTFGCCSLGITRITINYELNME